MLKLFNNTELKSQLFGESKTSSGLFAFQTNHSYLCALCRQESTGFTGGKINSCTCWFLPCTDAGLGGSTGSCWFSQATFSLLSQPVQLHSRVNCCSDWFRFRFIHVAETPSKHVAETPSLLLSRCCVDPKSLIENIPRTPLKNLTRFHWNESWITLF